MGKAGFCLITVEGVELVRRNNIEFPTHVVGLFPCSGESDVLLDDKFLSCEIWQKGLLNIMYYYTYKVTHVQELLLVDLSVRNAMELPMEHFVNRRSPFLPSRLCQYTKLQDMDNGNSIRKCTSTASFCKGNCVVQVDGIIYYRPLVVREGGSCESHYMYRQ
ncbi:hypothetical protein CDAR_587051 [Caerostris darwini]|uniref:Uncharacterized protein n=1 Tax=Caerostris darwini TaxID=1538125 RepID=A0AAV4U176_9ARAC|nr:hypothetical protein CDAR_587051 [Caerostris darwini]